MNQEFHSLLRFLVRGGGAGILLGIALGAVAPAIQAAEQEAASINEIWQSLYDDKRKPFIMQRWPENWLEIHPDDAAARGIESGDRVRVENNDVLIQTGGFVSVDSSDPSYTGLEKAGHIRVGKGALEAVALVTDAVRPGVTWTYFLNTDSDANSLAPRVPDPMTNRYRFKLGKGKIRRTGESKFKKSFTEATFKSRIIT